MLAAAAAAAYSAFQQQSMSIPPQPPTPILIGFYRIRGNTQRTCVGHATIIDLWCVGCSLAPLDPLFGSPKGEDGRSE